MILPLLLHLSLLMNNVAGIQRVKSLHTRDVVTAWYGIIRAVIGIILRQNQTGMQTQLKQRRSPQLPTEAW